MSDKLQLNSGEDDGPRGGKLSGGKLSVDLDSRGLLTNLRAERETGGVTLANM
jgi:hypothetical protein